MIRQMSSLMMVLAITACSPAEHHAPNTDTVALLRTVVNFASTNLHVGPKIVISRIPKSNPSARMSLATQNALVSSDSALSAVERYDIAHQVCDTVAKVPALCHFADVDGLIAVRDVILWRDSAHVAIEYYRTTATGAAAAGAKTAGKKALVYSAGDASLDRDVRDAGRSRGSAKRRGRKP